MICPKSPKRKPTSSSTISPMLKEQFGFEHTSDGNGDEAPAVFAAMLPPTRPRRWRRSRLPTAPDQRYLLPRHPRTAATGRAPRRRAQAGSRRGNGGRRTRRPRVEPGEEIKRVVATILSQYRNMGILLRDYDPATGAIPSCLPEEFHAPWIKALEAGRRPDIGFNRGGFYVRAGQYQRRSRPGSKRRHYDRQRWPWRVGRRARSKARRKAGAFLIRPFVPRDPLTLPPRHGCIPALHAPQRNRDDRTRRYRQIIARPDRSDCHGDVPQSAWRAARGAAARLVSQRRGRPRRDRPPNPGNLSALQHPARGTARLAVRDIRRRIRCAWRKATATSKSTSC